MFPNIPEIRSLIMQQNKFLSQRFLIYNSEMVFRLSYTRLGSGESKQYLKFGFRYGMVNYIRISNKTRIVMGIKAEITIATNSN